MAGRLRVLVLAYMVSPQRGTEFAVAWNYVQVMRRHCDLTILYGSAGEHMGQYDDFTEPTFIDRHPDGDVEFRFVPEPPLAHRLNALNRRGVLTYSFYLAYRAWHRAVLDHARRLVAERKYDLIHYVGPIGYREPGDLWRLPLPYVWGPIGGATSFPWRFRSGMSSKGLVRLMIRSAGNALQLHFGRRVDRALHRTDVLLTATTENQTIFRRLKGVDSIYLPENGIDGDIRLNGTKFPIDCVRIVWIGSLEARKGLTLLLQAVARMPDRRGLTINVVGDGPDRTALQKQAMETGIAEHIVWHGRVPRTTVMTLLDDAHLHVITGLNEANTTSVWEALGRSVPVLALDHCGMHDVVQPPYGIRVPLIDVEGTINGIAVALGSLVDDPARLEAMARSCAAACERFRIEHRAPVLLDAYQTAITRFHGRGATS